MVGIDLGSNTIRAVLIDCDSFERKKMYERAIRCADGLQASGMIGEDALKRAIEAIEEIKSQFPMERYKGVATAAFRIAKNGQKIVDEIYTKTGVKFDIIDSDMEAYLTIEAIKHRIGVLGLDERFVTVDIGGASTEISFVDKNDIVSESFPVGIVTMSQKYGSKEVLSIELPRELEGAKEFVRDMRYTGFRPKNFLATSGAPTTLAAMKLGFDSRSYDYKRISGTELVQDELNGFLDGLLRMEVAKREQIAGVGRGDLIVAGVLIFRELFKIVGFKKCIIIDDSLREGVAIVGCRDMKQRLNSYHKISLQVKKM